MKRYDVVALGELLIDFTPVGSSESGNPLFEQNPGGAPANVLIQIARLGGKAAFIGKVGRDAFGSFLENKLKLENVDADGLIFSPYHTTMAFVCLDDKGDRSFSFCREGAADINLSSDEIPYDLIDETKIFHFGGLSLTGEPARSATLAAVRYAKEKNKCISFDPNWRAPLWRSPEEAIYQMKQVLPLCDIVKVSEEELEMLTGEKDLESGCEILTEQGIALVFVTRGPKGCYLYTREGNKELPTYDTSVVDTTGAGDAFTGAMLYQISQEDVIPDFEKLCELVDFANAAGALCASKYGAIPAIATKDEIRKCQKEMTYLLNN